MQDKGIARFVWYLLAFLVGLIGKGIHAAVGMVIFVFVIQVGIYNFFMGLFFLMLIMHYDKFKLLLFDILRLIFGIIRFIFITILLSKNKVGEKYERKEYKRSWSITS